MYLVILIQGRDEVGVNRDGTTSRNLYHADLYTLTEARQVAEQTGGVVTHKSHVYEEDGE